MSKPTGGYAFPSSVAIGPSGDVNTSDQWPESAGMTLRAYLAAKAMQGLCADPSNHKLYTDMEDMAANAVDIADAMIAALAK